MSDASTSRRPRWFARFLWSFTRWVLLPVAGMTLASAAAYGLGWAVYAARGMPNHWKSSEASQQSMRFLMTSNPQPQISGLYSRLGVGSSEEIFIRLAQNGRWFPEEPGLLRRMDDDFQALYRLDENGRVSRVTIVVPGVEALRARDANARMQQVWGLPVMEAGELPSSPVTPQVLAFEIDNARVLVEYITSDRLWTMVLTIVGETDALYTAFEETGGLPPGHPLAAEMTKSRVEAGKQKASQVSLGRAVLRRP